MIEVSALAAELNQRIDSLAPEILPNGRRQGREWVVGSLAGERGKSLSICLSGTKRGRWKDFASGEGGDALELVAGALFAGNRREAIHWAKAWLGLDDGPAPARRPRRAPPPPDPEAEARERAAAQDRARRLFAAARHRIAGTPVDLYLRGRAIDLSRLGRQPGRLAFAPALWCEERGARLPAMVAAICIGPRIVGVHRTYLAEAADPATGEIGWVKAPLECPKKTLGPWAGGCIPLWQGGQALGWRQLWEAPAEATGGQSVTLTEGIEDALSIAIADPGRRVAATISLAGLASVELPPSVTEVVIAGDNDPGPRERAALNRAIDAHLKAGRRVLSVTAPAPHKDFNDWLRALAADEGRQAA